MAKKINFNEMTAVELNAKSAELRRELFNLRLQQATSRLEKTHRIRALRRDIARCETRLSKLRTTATTAK